MPRYCARAFAPAQAARAPRAHAHALALLAEFSSLNDACDVAWAEYLAETEDGPMPVWSREPFDSSPARAWCVATFGEMAAWLAHQRPADRRVHELVTSDVEVRFAADLDLKTEDSDDGRLDLCVRELQEHVRAILGLTVAPRAFVATSSRPGKHSRHVTFPELVLQSWPHVRALGVLVERRASGELRAAMDMNVFERERGTLRTLYCTAHGKNSWLVPLGDDPLCGTTRFDAAKWTDALVTYVPPGAPPALQLSEDLLKEAGVRATKPRAALRIQEPDVFRDLEPGAFYKVRECMAAYYTNLFAEEHGTYAEADDRVSSNSVGIHFKRFPCAQKGGPHEGNRVLVTWTLRYPAVAAAAVAAAAAPGFVSAPKALVVGVAMQCMNKAKPCNRARWEATTWEVATCNAVARCALLREPEEPEEREDVYAASERAPPNPEAEAGVRALGGPGSA